jgi:VWFA-related protein
MRVASEGIRAAAIALVDALRPSDRAMVVSFDNRIRVLSEFTSDRAELQRAISQLRPRALTRLYDALTLAVLDRINVVESRKAIVLFTDGVDTGSQLTNAAGAVAAIDTSNVAVYVIRYDTSDSAALVPTTSAVAQQWLAMPDDTQKNPQALAAADQFLGRLAAESGGRMYLARPDASVREMLAQISQELSRQYVLCYYPANDKLDGTYREIRVTVDRPDQTVRARTGYRAGALQSER